MVKINLSDVSETLLIPLWARAYETTHIKNPLVRDERSVEMMNHIDYDFSKFKNANKSQVGIAVRSKILDRETKKFLTTNPNAVCINIGCGLDTRFYRVDNGQIHWYNLDFPEVMEIRKQFFEKNDRIHEIPCSCFDENWITNVKTSGKPVLFLMEGLSMYFTEEQMKDFFSMLIRHFPKAQILLEVMPPFLIKQQKRHDAVDAKKAPFLWGIKDGKNIESFHKDIRFLAQWTYYEGHRVRWGLMGFLSLIPWWNKNVNCKIISLQWGHTESFCQP